MVSELDNAQMNATLSKSMRSKCAVDCPVAVVDSIEQLSLDRTRLVEASTPHGVDLFLAPVTGPISVWQLSRVRPRAEEK